MPCADWGWLIVSHSKVHIFWEFYEISTVDFYCVVPVKSRVDILQNFVVFSDYMNFNIKVHGLTSVNGVPVAFMPMQESQQTFGPSCFDRALDTKWVRIVFYFP